MSIYSKTWEDHLQHVDQILSIMEGQSLYAKESKCEFGMTEVLYLGHIIGEKGVKVHQEKIQAILDWSVIAQSVLAQSPRQVNAILA